MKVNPRRQEFKCRHRSDRTQTQTGNVVQFLMAILSIDWWYQRGFRPMRHPERDLEGSTDASQEQAKQSSQKAACYYPPPSGQAPPSMGSYSFENSCISIMHEIEQEIEKEAEKLTSVLPVLQ